MVGKQTTCAAMQSCSLSQSDKLLTSCPVVPFFREGFPFKVKQQRKDALFSHGHWTSELTSNKGGRADCSVDGVLKLQLSLWLGADERRGVTESRCFRGCGTLPFLRKLHVDPWHCSGFPTRQCQRCVCVCARFFCSVSSR